MTNSLLVLVGPSGAGKTAISAVLERRFNVHRIITCTTRMPRPGEVDGQDYQFLTYEDFIDKIALREFAEHAEVHNDLYGTLREDIDWALKTSAITMLIMDIQGAQAIHKLYPDAHVFFIAAPMDQLIRRLRERKMPPEKFAARVAQLEKEMLSAANPVVRTIVPNPDGNLDVAAEKIYNTMLGVKESPLDQLPRC